MLELLRAHHRLLTVRGAIALLFAVLAFAWPDTDWTVQFGVLIAYLLAEGVCGALLAFRDKEATALDRALLGVPALLLLAGMLFTAVMFGAIPLLALFGIVIISAGWPIVNGIGLVLSAARARELFTRLGLAISGTLSIVAGVVVMNVTTEQASLWTVLAGYAAVSGAIFVALGVWYQRGGGKARRR